MDSLSNIINLVCISSVDLDEKIQTLKRKFDTLGCQEAEINAHLVHAESSSTKQRRKEVENWLKNVDSTRDKVEKLELQISRSRTWRGLLGRNQLRDRVEDLTKEVAEFMEQGSFPQGLTLDAHKEVTLPTSKFVGQAFERNLTIIWEYLRKSEGLKIGIWGMAGVGKTTLAKHIYNRILIHSGTFDHVCWITVKQNSSIYKLQDDIAKAFGFNILFEDDEIRRAEILSRELMRRKKSILILDDVWDEICLEMLGITTAVSGCKLLITTRSLDVCQKLRCQEKIWIQPLSKEEAWYLFEENLRHPKMVYSQSLLEVAKNVADKCAGLPLGIVTLANCMKEVNDVSEWTDVLQELNKFDVLEENLFKVFEISFNRLNDSMLKQCFLYCVLYPEDYDIEREELIQNLIDGGLIGKMRDRQAQFDIGHNILNKLVYSGLLEAVDCNFVDGLKGVRMHDLVRDMAIKMASTQFMVKSGMQLNEIPEEHEWLKDVVRVSLMGNKINEIVAGASLRCPKLQTLFLSNNYSLKKIENSFFEHMPDLKILELSGCGDIEELPNSLSNLKNLRALVLRWCSKLQIMTSLAKLTSLKRLDLSWSGIKEVPHGLEMLANLTYLDLSYTENLKVFPSGILTKLSQLEYLKFDLKVVKIKGEELKRLERLCTFKGRLVFDDKVNGSKEYVISRRRNVGTDYNYTLLLDDGDKYVEESYNSKCNLNKLLLKNWSICNRAEEDVNVETLEALIKDVQILTIERCKVARSLSDVWWLDNAAHNLKRCYIEYCEGIECVGSFSNPLLFHTIEIIGLDSLKNLRMLFELEGERKGPIVPPSLPAPAIGSVFSCLISFTINKCDKIKKLFQPGLLPSLRNLEEIHVDECKGLKEIITATSKVEEEATDDEVEQKEEATAEEEQRSSGCSSYHSYSSVQYILPKLKTLHLSLLPELESICEGTLACHAVEVIKVIDCPLLERIPLSQRTSSLQSFEVRGNNRKQLLESLKWDY